MNKTVIVLTCSPWQYRAAVLNRSDGVFELRALESRPADKISWPAFCEQAVRSASQNASASHSPLEVVVGFDSSCVTFYRFMIPTVKPDQRSAIVKLQAETLLPMPIEQMEIAWYAGPPQQEKLPITLAAARTARLQDFAQQLRSCPVDSIRLDVEGIVKARQVLFDDAADESVIVYIGSNCTQICLTHADRLALAVTCELGRDELTAIEGLVAPKAQQLAQDVRSALILFDNFDLKDRPLCVLSDKQDICREVADYLTRTGLNAQVPPPQPKNLKRAPDLADADIFEYLAPIGLALAALQQDPEKLDLFTRFDTFSGKDQKKKRLFDLKLTALSAAAMLILFVLVSYGVDVARLKKINNYLRQTDPNATINHRLSAQRIKRAIAAQRPDLLEPLILVNACATDGVMLDGFTFKIGKPASVIGHASNNEQIYAFQEALQNQKGIKAVTIQNRSQGEKKKEITFTITFEYKKFHKKRASAPLTKMLTTDN